MAKKKGKQQSSKAKEAEGTLPGSWAEFISEQGGSLPTDINAIVQQTLRDAYLEANQDLEFYADKLRFYNSLKKAIRDEVKKVHKARRSLNGSKGCKNAGDPIKAYVPLSFDTAITLDENCRPVIDPGEGKPLTTWGELEDYVEGLENTLQTVGDDAQLANIDLQSILQKQQQTLQMMSNISKMLHDTTMSVIRNIGS
jgi:hypothetical protein